MEQRKGFQWYKTLTKKQQKQFRLNCHRCEDLKGIKNLNLVLNETLCFFRFVYYGFDFDKTPQGYKYWEDLAYSRD